jgi:hypothetical protein
VELPQAGEAMRPSTMQQPSGSYLTPEFDDFLFALINEDGDKTPLSVLSLFARRGVDPWEEAANLAQLPHASAAERLISLIASIPGGLPACSDAKTISDRLLALLPPPPGLNISAREKLGVPGLTATWFAIWILIASILLIQLM